MRLAVVTDHRFSRHDSGIYDTYCFDREFFDDYRAVFEEIVVAARVQETLPSMARRSDGNGVSFVALPDLRGARWAVGLDPAFLRRVWTTVQAADAVCVRIPSVSGTVAARVATLAGKPLMFEMIGDPAAALQAEQHGVLAGLLGRLSARSARRIAKVSVCGSYVSHEHLQQYYPPGAGVVTASISSIRLAPADIMRPRAPQRVLLRPLRVVLVASLVAVKCHDMLIRAVAGVRKVGPLVSLDLVGDGPLRPRLEALTAKLGLTDHVRFHGHVSDRERMKHILDEADLFAMTSASEGMPRSMIEAMARGLPAIGTRTGGIAELLPPSQLVDPGDAEGLACMLQQIVERPELLGKLSEHSIATAKEFLQPVLSERRRALLATLRAAVVGSAVKR